MPAARVHALPRPRTVILSIGQNQSSPDPLLPFGRNMASCAVRPEAGSQVRLQRRTHLAFGGQIENLGREGGFRSPVIVIGQGKPGRDHGGRSEGGRATGGGVRSPEK